MVDATESEKPLKLDTKQATEEKHKSEHENSSKDEKKPAGGYDSTPVAKIQPGWTVRITFHRATNLPMADINSMSSDPYILADMSSSLPKRHKEDPPLQLRTPTIRRNTNPEWNTEWIVANAPSSGFRLGIEVFDEDPSDHDDRLGHVHVHVDSLSHDWQGIHHQSYKIKKRYGSKRAYLVRSVSTCMRRTKTMHGNLILSIELLGRTKDETGGRMYTLGPCWWTRHYSPMLGRLANLKEPRDDQQGNEADPKQNDSADGKKTQRYNFEANQMQLAGPVPAELYHRYVEFKPFVKGMFTGSGLRGFLLSKALHHQHNRVYNFSQTTVWGRFDEKPGADVTKEFLDHVHYNKGGRIFTYVLTLDALFRFTETGKEFGIDMLSKHTMHSNVNIYIAFSGEFFIRRLEKPNQPPPPDPPEETSQIHPDLKNADQNKQSPPDDFGSSKENDKDPVKDPASYELIIDNDSGTYRPNADLLPLLKDFLARSLPGLHIQTLDCQADADKMKKWKQEQRDRKKQEGNNVVYMQGNGSSGSVSSSDEEELDRLEAGGSNDAGELHLRDRVKQDAHMRGQKRVERLKRNNPKHQRQQVDADNDQSGQ